MPIQKSHKVKKVADIFDCSVPTIYRMIHKKKLKAFMVGDDMRVTEDEIIRVQKGEVL